MSPTRITPPLERLEQASTPRSPWSDAWERLRKNYLAVASFWIFIIIAAFCYLGPFVHPYSPERQHRTLRATPPFSDILEYKNEYGRIDQIATRDFLLRNPNLDGSIKRAIEQEQAFEYEGLQYSKSDDVYVFGTDGHGRDLMARLMQGGRISIGVGFLATLVSLMIGVIYGSIAGLRGGTLDAFMMRLVDILYSLPFTIFVILLMVVFGRSILLIFISIGAVEWLTIARISRNQVMHLKQQDFVRAAVAIGVRQSSIIGRHLIPNMLGPIVVYATLSVPAIMVLESILSFLGLGVQPPSASWGSLISDGAQKMTVYPWLLFIPAAFFSATLFAMNFLGDGLRDALDVKSAKD